MRLPRLLHAAAFVPAALLAYGGVSAQPAPAEAVAAATAQLWSAEAAGDLLDAIDAADREGLTPADYDPAVLRRAIAAGPGAELDRAANAAGLALARDYLLGRVQDKAAFDWHIERSPYEAHALTDGLAKAAAAGRVKPWLASLLPADPQYGALRDALAEAREPARVALIRANMERWRWMPRTMGSDYLFVNVPTYTLRVMRGGVEDARYDVVVGAPKTPTPALAVPAERVVVNPWWTLPPSVLAEGRRYPAAKGYVYTRAASGQTMVRQKPGPMNALGRIKIDMPNVHAIYLHDTPAKAAFAKAYRALSHGCIRVQDIEQLAADLQGDGAVEEALAGDATASIALPRTMPVYIVYLTARADGGEIVPVADIYARDARLLAALDAGATTRLAVSGTRTVAAR